MDWKSYLPKNWQQIALYVLAVGTVSALTAYGCIGPNDIPLPDPPEPVFQPSEVQSNGGWVKDDEAVKAVQETLAFKVFADTPAGKADDPLPESVYLWQSYTKLFARGPPSKNQLDVGSCVSFGTNNAIERTLATQIVLKGGGKDEFKHIVEEVTYGGSRVEIGGGKIRGDGSVGAWAAQFVQKWGIVARDKYGAYDLTTYNTATCRKFGQSGVPQDIEKIARERPVKDITLVKTWDSAKKALASGYGIAICSNVGFDGKRDANGAKIARGQWAHCVPKGTMISTQIPKPCEDIRVGDQVIAHDGKMHAVLQVIPTEFDGSLRVIETFGATPVKFTPEHPLLVYRRMTHSVRRVPAGVDFRKWNNGAAPYQIEAFEKWENEQPAWIAARDVQPGDYLLSPEVKVSGEVRLPTWLSRKKTLNRPNPILAPDADLAWLFGLYIADGSAVAGHRIHITLNKHETDSIAKACVTFRKIGLEPSIIDGGTYVRVAVYSADAADSFREWFGTESHVKRIPEFLFHGWDLLAVVEGVFAGDGCDNRNAKIISTTSPALALQIQQILLSNGENPSMSEVHRSGGEFPNARDSWSVSWRPVHQKSFMRHWRGFYLMPVSKISDEAYKGTVYNYEVEGAHSYLSWNVVSHNCMTLDGYATINGKEYGHIDNSWGARPEEGPVGPGDPPTSGFYADSATIGRMLAQGDSWAFSGVTGFPRRELDWFVAAPRRNAIRFASLKPDREVQYASIP